MELRFPFTSGGVQGLFLKGEISGIWVRGRQTVARGPLGPLGPLGLLCVLVNKALSAHSCFCSLAPSSSRWWNCVVVTEPRACKAANVYRVVLHREGGPSPVPASLSLSGAGWTRSSSTGLEMVSSDCVSQSVALPLKLMLSYKTVKSLKLGYPLCIPICTTHSAYVARPVRLTF